jgi:hypothetical protein
VFLSLAFLFFLGMNLPLAFNAHSVVDTGCSQTREFHIDLSQQIIRPKKGRKFHEPNHNSGSTK